MANIENWVHIHLQKGYDTHTLKQAMRSQGYQEKDLRVVDEIFSQALKEKSYFSYIVRHLNIVKAVLAIILAFILGVALSFGLYKAYFWLTGA